MRIENVWSGRPNYYDRNPVSVVNNVSVNVPPDDLPHLYIIYTVPANRAAFIVQIGLEEIRFVAPQGDYHAYQRALYGPGTLADPIFYENDTYDPNVGVIHDKFSAPGFIAQAGQSVSMSGTNAATVGDAYMLAMLSAVEFDA